MADRHIPDGMTAVPLSKAARHERALELAGVVKQISDLDSEWAEQKREHAKKLTGLEERMATLADDVRTGTELKEKQGGLWDAETLRGAAADAEDDDAGETAEEKPKRGRRKKNPSAACDRCVHSIEAHGATETDPSGACQSAGCTCTAFEWSAGRHSVSA